MSNNKVANKNTARSEDAPTFPAWVKHAAWFLRKFGELSWLKNLKNFIFDFAVQASELLVVLALVISMVNFLTHGALVSSTPWLTEFWAWLQGVAIDAGFGVVLVNFLDSARKKNTVQATIYFLLTALLAFNAGAVTYIDSLASAAHLPMNDPGVNPFPLWVLSLTRAIAVVGFLGVARIHSYDFSGFVLPQFLQQAKEDTLVSVEEAKVTEQVLQLSTQPQAQIEAPSSDVESKNVESENDLENDEDATIITMPEFPQKRKTGKVRKIVEVQESDENEGITERIIKAMSELRESGDKVTDMAIAKKLQVSRHTVMRNKPKTV